MLLIGIMLAVAVGALLLWNLRKRMAADAMQRLNDERRSSCRLVGRGELVDGKQHIPIAMALSSSTLFALPAVRSAG